MKQQDDAVRHWLLTWQDLIAQGDFDAASKLFAPEAVGFGTVAVRADGLPELVERQWKRVWKQTSDFRFLLDTLYVWDGAQVLVAAVQWVSTGRDASTGAPFERQGRATIVLRSDGPVLCGVHTHFSINPVPERFLAA